MAKKEKRINKIGIVGYGRFGKLAHKIFSKTLPEIKILINSKDRKVDNKKFFTLTDVAKCDVVILSVPISEFESAVKKVAPLVLPHSTVVDVCSVKVFPKRLMKYYFSKEVNIIATHPMFGPGDVNSFGESVSLEGFNFVIENVRSNKQVFSKVQNYLSSLGLNIISMSAEEHDMIMAKRQLVTLTLAFVLKGIDFKPHKIDTKTAENLSKSVDGVTIDFTLLSDIYRYNPYCKEELIKLIDSFKEITEKLQ